MEFMNSAVATVTGKTKRALWFLIFFCAREINGGTRGAIIVETKACSKNVCFCRLSRGGVTSKLKLAVFKNMKARKAFVGTMFRIVPCFFILLVR